MFTVLPRLQCSKELSEFLEGITIRWVHAQFLNPSHPNFLNDCTLAPELTHGWHAGDQKHKKLQVPNFCRNSGPSSSQGLLQFTSMYLRRYPKHTTAASGYKSQNQYFSNCILLLLVLNVAKLTNFHIVIAGFALTMHGYHRQSGIFRWNWFKKSSHWVSRCRKEPLAF